MRLPDLARHDTYPKLLALHAAEHPRAIALREKDYGIWNEVSWAEYHRRTRAIALGLRDLGIGAEAVVALIGDNRPQWVMGQIAIHALGALSLGVYRDALDEEVVHLLSHAGAIAIFAEDEEQIDKLLAIAERLPSLRWILYDDPRGMRKYDDPRLLALAELEARGEALHQAEPDLYDRLVAAGDGEKGAVLCATSGTTSNPKLAVLPPARVLRHMRRYLEIDPKGPEDDYVSVLPLPWIMEQLYVFGQALLCRMKVNFVEEPETLTHDMREIGPTFLLLAPRVWEGMAADMRARIMEATALKRRLYDLGMRLGMAAQAKGRRSLLAEILLFRALRDRLGLSRVRSAATGGAALGPDTFRFFLALGVPLRQIYGQTEAMGAYTLHEIGKVDFDSVGKPFGDAIEVRIDNPDQNGVGEVVARHDNMSLGYHRNPDESAALIREGWMYTGDAGYFDGEGRLVVIDRIRDIATTSSGERFSPQYIENKLKFSPYIAEAVILGHQREALSAIICIRFTILSKWAEKNRIAFTTYTDLSSRPEIYALIRRAVEEVNATLPPASRIAKFVLLYKELDADDGELTRTRKVRRGVINEKYRDIVEALYSARETIPVDTVIAFQDGTRQRIHTVLKVETLSEPARASAVAA